MEYNRSNVSELQEVASEMSTRLTKVNEFKALKYDKIQKVEAFQEPAKRKTSRKNE
jgi:hypothetical protein